MKKVLTILAILVVLTSAIFAAETHKIKITATVEDVPPVFALELNEDKEVTTKEKTVNSDGYFDGGAYDTGKEINSESVEVTVLAKLLSAVKLANTTVYTLEFKADPLKSSLTHKVGNAATYTVYEIKASKTDSAIAEASGAKAGITIGNPSALDYDEDDAVVGTITATMDTSNILAANLATFHVVYAADENAPVDDYEAYITLTITT